MQAKKFFMLTVLTALLASSFPILPVFAQEQTFLERAFDSPIDAFSVRMQSTTFAYSTKTADGWSDWMTYEDDGDSEIGAESELIMVARGTRALRVRSIISTDDIHPIIVSHEPVRTRIAAVSSVSIHLSFPVTTGVRMNRIFSIPRQLNLSLPFRVAILLKVITAETQASVLA